MTDAHFNPAFELTSAQKTRAIGGLFAGIAIWLGAFFSGFVIAQPAPYEIFLAVVIPIWAIFGLKIPTAISPLILLLVLFNLGGIISLMTMTDWDGAVIYVAVSFFLAATSIFFAAIISAKPEHLKLLYSGYLFAALITGALGILGYFGAIPGAEQFTLFGRAKGVFKDPNVFAPFLCLPSIWCLYNILTRPFARAVPYAAAFFVLAIALFLSFSRAGWGLFVLSTALLVFSMLISNQSGRFRIRIIMLSLIAVVGLLITLLVALQFESVRELFVIRAQLVQEYDGSRMGRFARQWLGFVKATEHPFGIGILQFGKIFGEDPHNIWLKALFDYSWLGFASYVTLMVWTLISGFKILFRNRFWQPFLLCAYIVFIGHILIGNVIDTDHWRHFFLLLGIIWGCVAAEANHQRQLQQTSAI